MSLAGEQCSPLPRKIQVQPTDEIKKLNHYPLFLLHMQAQKKKLQKRKRRYEISRSAERDKGSAPLNAAPFEKGARKLYYAHKKGRKNPAFFILNFFSVSEIKHQA